jgi:hypothetical protein
VGEPADGVGRIDLPGALGALATVANGECTLPPGTFELVAPLRLSGNHLRLRGARGESGPLTLLRRGCLADGSLYQGALVEVVDAHDVEIESLRVDGARFWSSHGERRDRRHPLDADRSSPRFPCASELPAPDCFDPAARLPTLAPDVFLLGASAITLRGMHLREAVRIAIGIGPACRDVRVVECAVGSAGDYGVWLGSDLRGDEPLPLDDAQRARLPARVSIEDSHVARSGAAGIYVEATDARIERTLVDRNHFDAPYDDESGQIVIDYRARGVQVRDCRIVDGGLTYRADVDGDPRKVRLLGTVGIEACGGDLEFADVVIEGNSREGIQLIGARDVRIGGPKTRIAGNHRAEREDPDRAGRSQRQNVSVTTTAEMRHVRAIGAGLVLRDARIENGLLVWAHPTAADLRFDRLAISGCDLSGPDASGVTVGSGADGHPARGQAWSIES